MTTIHEYTGKASPQTFEVFHEFPKEGVHKGVLTHINSDTSKTLFYNRDPFDGKMYVMKVDMKISLFREHYNMWKHQGILIQNAFPMLNADEREFIMTGITPDNFPSDDEERLKEF